MPPPRFPHALPFPTLRRWIEVIDTHFKLGTAFSTFNDWEGLETYDSAARQKLTSWLIANTRHMRSADFLVASKLVAMGVSAANVMTTLAGLTMVAHTERAAFEAAYRAAAR